MKRQKRTHCFFQTTRESPSASKNREIKKPRELRKKRHLSLFLTLECLLRRTPIFQNRSYLKHLPLFLLQLISLLSHHHLPWLTDRYCLILVLTKTSSRTQKILLFFPRFVCCFFIQIQISIGFVFLHLFFWMHYSLGEKKLMAFCLTWNCCDSRNLFVICFVCHVLSVHAR